MFSCYTKNIYNPQDIFPNTTGYLWSNIYIHRLEQFSTSNLCDDVFEQPVRRCKLILGFFLGATLWLIWFGQLRAAKLEDATTRYFCQSFCSNCSCSCSFCCCCWLAWRLSFICCFSTFFMGPKWLRWLRDAVNWFVRKSNMRSACLAGRPTFVVVVNAFLLATWMKWRPESSDHSNNNSNNILCKFVRCGGLTTLFFRRG